MSVTPNLEAKLEKSQAKDAKAFWHQYNTVKGFLSKDYYPWIQANCPYFTDHGENHVNAVIRAASSLIQIEIKKMSSITILDIYLILSAIIWHDIGMIQKRTGHADEVVKIIKNIRGILSPSPDILRLVTALASAHSGNNGLIKASSEEDVTTANLVYTVFPRKLAAILRFADEISEDRNRISESIMSTVPEENKIYWKYASCISACRPDPLRSRIVLTLNIEATEAIIKYDCPTNFSEHADGDGKISLIEYIICRIEKINNERIYCGKEFAKYVDIREIVTRFTLLNDGDVIKNYDTSEIIFTDKGLDLNTYPQIPIYEEFFSTHNNWKPDSILDILNL